MPNKTVIFFQVSKSNIIISTHINLPENLNSMFFTILGTKSNVQAKVDRSKSYATTIMSKNSDRRFKHTENLYILGLDDKQTTATTGQWENNDENISL